MLDVCALFVCVLFLSGLNSLAACVCVCAQVLPMRLAALEADTDAQAKIIWTMKVLAWRDPGLEQVLGGLIPNLGELL